jgi:small basic protein
MMMFWAWAGVPLGVYNIVSHYNIALQIQPQILTVLSLATWIQCLHYERSWSVTRSLAVVVPIACIMGGIEVALVFALQIGTRSGTHWPVTLMAVLAALFLALGVLRHYCDIYLHRHVRGISFLFVGIDALGDLLSIVSVLFQSELDILGLVIYGTELALWIGIFACGGYYNLIPWVKSQRCSVDGGGCPVDNDIPRDGTGVALHNPPSSTSVFRTPSSDSDMRSRAAGRRREELS